MLHFYDDAYASPGAGWDCTSKHLTSIGVERGFNGVKGNVGLADNVQGWVCYADCPLVHKFIYPLAISAVFTIVCMYVALDLPEWKIPHRELYFYNNELLHRVRTRYLQG